MHESELNPHEGGSALCGATRRLHALDGPINPIFPCGVRPDGSLISPMFPIPDLSRPRRGEWWTSWANLPGFVQVNGRYRHECLPGWEYARSEIRAEMIPDLEALAERGVRPTEETSGGGASG